VLNKDRKTPGGIPFNTIHEMIQNIIYRNVMNRYNCIIIRTQEND